MRHRLRRLCRLRSGLGRLVGRRWLLRLLRLLRLRWLVPRRLWRRWLWRRWWLRRWLLRPRRRGLVSRRLRRIATREHLRRDEASGCDDDQQQHCLAHVKYYFHLKQLDCCRLGKVH
jgi:hypothetical protein